MGNAIYGDHLACYDTFETCSKGCGRYECVFVDKCNGNANAHYVCLPFDLRFFMWLLVGIFVIVVLCCSAIVACYAIRAIRASFRHAIGTDGDIVFQNSPVLYVPHPGSKYASQGDRDWAYRRNEKVV